MFPQHQPTELFQSVHWRRPCDMVESFGKQNSDSEKKYNFNLWINQSQDLTFIVSVWSFFSPKNWWFGYICTDPNLSLCFLDYLIDNIYVEFDKTLHKQTVGIPKGMCCAPFWPTFFMSYEYQFFFSCHMNRACDHFNDLLERHISLYESLIRQGYKYGFLCKQLCSTFKKQSAIFAKYSKSFEDIKMDIPFTAMVVNPQFVTVRSQSRTSSS